MRSLRNRLLAAMLGAMFVILIAAASLLFGLIRGALVVKFDEVLLAKARGLPRWLNGMKVVSNSI